MPAKNFHEDLFDYCNWLVADTKAKDYYEEYLLHFKERDDFYTSICPEIKFQQSKLKPLNDDRNFEVLDRLHNDELNSLFIKMIQIGVEPKIILENTSPLLQALLYRRFKKVLDFYNNKDKAINPKGQMLLMHSLFVLWPSLNSDTPTLPNN